jgi:hypothetical protein
VEFLISIKAFIFEAAVLEHAVAISLQLSFHESLQVICGIPFFGFSASGLGNTTNINTLRFYKISGCGASYQ